MCLSFDTSPLSVIYIFYLNRSAAFTTAIMSMNREIQRMNV